MIRHGPLIIIMNREKVRAFREGLPIFDYKQKI